MGKREKKIDRFRVHDGLLALGNRGCYPYLTHLLLNLSLNFLFVGIPKMLAVVLFFASSAKHQALQGKQNKHEKTKAACCTLKQYQDVLRTQHHRDLAFNRFSRNEKVVANGKWSSFDGFKKV